MENAWLDEAAQLDPFSYTIAINAEAARSAGSSTGRPRLGRDRDRPPGQGPAEAHRGIHPEGIGIAAMCGHWSDGMPVAKGKGVFFNDLLELDWDHVSPVNLNLDLCVRVRVVPDGGPAMRLGDGHRPQALHRLLRLPTRPARPSTARRPACSAPASIKQEIGPLSDREPRSRCRCCAITARIAPCVDSCPTGASFVWEDGTVDIDADKCVGCRTCMMACPYSNRYFVEERTYYETGRRPRSSSTTPRTTSPAW